MADRQRQKEEGRRPEGRRPPKAADSRKKEKKAQARPSADDADGADDEPRSSPRRRPG